MSCENDEQKKMVESIKDGAIEIFECYAEAAGLSRDAAVWLGYAADIRRGWIPGDAKKAVEALDRLAKDMPALLAEAARDKAAPKVEIAPEAKAALSDAPESPRLVEAKANHAERREKDAARTELEKQKRDDDRAFQQRKATWHDLDGLHFLKYVNELPRWRQVQARIEAQRRAESAALKYSTEFHQQADKTRADDAQRVRAAFSPLYAAHTLPDRFKAEAEKAKAAHDAARVMSSTKGKSNRAKSDFDRTR